MHSRAQHTKPIPDAGKKRKTTVCKPPLWTTHYKPQVAASRHTMQDTAAGVGRLESCSSALPEHRLYRIFLFFPQTQMFAKVFLIPTNIYVLSQYNAAQCAFPVVKKNGRMQSTVIFQERRLPFTLCGRKLANRNMASSFGKF
ncbi:hypothetical protein E2C01_010051 [Portunus trituberculatus]|uniref:Uncharacterized protein n=1 Tax=Portunus trituberculatus TaxID=210409 RepID=A0A5B7D7L9_PORTR|nr:hypothetical protein [Portunus trituberculatus]